MKILKKLGETGFTSSIFTSYSCDLPFYEKVIVPQLRAVGCLNNMLLVDAFTYAKSIETTARLVNEAGRTYSVVPQLVSGAFHPKLLLQVGPKKGRLLIGSANVSLEGFGKNRELMSEIFCTDEESPEQAIVVQAFNYLCKYLPGSISNVSYKIKQALADSVWLSTTPEYDGQLQLADGSDISFLTAPEAKLGQEYARLIDGDQICRLVIVSPFWDKKLQALSDIIGLLAPKKVLLLLQPETVSFPSKALQSLDCELSIYDIGGKKERYVHAKLMIAEGKKADHIMMGSANCSLAALGSRRTAPYNAEACIYLRVARGTALAGLKLDEKINGDSELDSSSISDMSYKEEIGAGQDEESFFPGHIEENGRVIVWTPYDNVDTEGTLIELLNNELEPLGKPLKSINRTAEQVFFPVIEGKIQVACFARIIVPEGKASVPVIVHHNESLRRAAPGSAATRIHSLLMNISPGDSGYLNLLDPFEKILFVDQDKTKEEPTGNRLRKVVVDSGIDSKDTIPYEEFIKGRHLKLRGQNQLFVTSATNMSVLMEFLNRFFRQNDTLIESEEIEEDTEYQDEKEPEDSSGAGLPSIQLFPRSEIERARRRVRSLIEKYLDWTQLIVKDKVDGNHVTSFWALMALVGVLFGKPLMIEDKTKERVIPAGPIPNKGYRCDFIHIARAVLTGFFFQKEESPVSKVILPANVWQVPSEHYGAWSFAIWMLCMSSILASESKDEEALQDLESIGYRIYSLTGISSGNIDNDELLKKAMNIHNVLEIGDIYSWSNLIPWHHWYMDMARTCRKPNKWHPAKYDGSNSPFQVGDRVWYVHGEPRYVRLVTGTSVYLNEPYLNFTQENNLDYKQINSGYVFKLGNIDRP